VGTTHTPDKAPPPDTSDSALPVDVSDGAAPVDVSDGAAPVDVSDASPMGDVGSDADAALPPVAVVATQNGLELDHCSVTPALLSAIPAGTYTIALTASTLSKGAVSGMIPSTDNYVVVNLPLPAGDPHEDHRFFMLNGIGANASVTLPAAGTIQLMFIDSDMAANSGEATVTLDPGGYSATVNAANNVIRWDEGCLSTPAMLVVPAGPQRVTLATSSLSAGSGSTDNYVLIRMPSEMPMDDFRYVILNGVTSFFDFTPFNSNSLRAWFISSAGGSGQASLSVSAR
jgi:hypothetical protein